MVGPGMYAPPSPPTGPASGDGGGTPPSAVPGTGPRPARSGMRLFGIRVWQIIAAEIAIAGIAAAATRRDWTLVPAIAVPVLLLALFLPRIGHRDLLSASLVRWRGRSRSNALARNAAVTADQPVTPLRILQPALHLSSIDLRNDRELGVVFDGSGWAGAIIVHRDDDLAPSLQDRHGLPLTTLAETLVVDDVRLASLQVLVHALPSPVPDSAPDSANAVSYRQVNPRGVPAHRQTFIVLRLDPTTSLESIEARGGGSLGARRALKRAVSRALELLESSGVPARPLSELGLRSALGHSAGLNMQVATGAPPTEHRRHLHLAGNTFVTWWVSRWPEGPTPLQTLTDTVTALPIPAVQISLELFPGNTATSALMRSVIRIKAVSPEAADLAGDLLTQAVDNVGFRLVRLDGEHLLGFETTLPLGGRP
jgi:type VII secretion protein EccE